MRSSRRTALESPVFSLLINSTLSSLEEDTIVRFLTTQRSSSRAAAPSVEDNKGIIIGSTLGGAALVLVCLALVLYPIWQRRRTPPKRTLSRLSNKTCPSPSPIPGPSASDFDSHRVRPVTPSPRRLVTIINTSPPVSRPWDVERGTAVHTPSGHPATIGWRRGGGGNSNVLGSDDSPVVVVSSTNRPKIDDDQGQAQLSSDLASISTTFAAEMSSILESISIKSSYSSLRSSGAAVLGVPTRLQTPLSVQKLRTQDNFATSVGGGGGAARGGGGSVPDSGGSNTDPTSSLMTVPSKSPPPSPKSDDNETGGEK